MPVRRRLDATRFARTMRATLVHYSYSEPMATRGKSAPSRSVWQCVTMPAMLAVDVRRVAKDWHVTMSRALVDLAERGVHAEAEAATQVRVPHIHRRSGARTQE